MINIADALDWPCRLLHSYGFMLHHHGISFSVDYNSQKPLIKPCGAKAFWVFFFKNNYLSLNESEALRFTDQDSTGQVPHKLLNPTEQFVLTEVCL